MITQAVNFNVSVELRSDLKHWRTRSAVARRARLRPQRHRILRFSEPILPLLPLGLRFCGRTHSRTSSLAHVAVCYGRRLGAGNPAFV